MLNNIKIENILFLDIETVPALKDYTELTEPMKSLWNRKAKQIRSNPEELPEVTYQRAGIYAEFGRIICISFGQFSKKNSVLKFRLKSIYGHNEAEIITEFNELLKKHYPPETHYLCAHNGKEFDFPYIARRSLINGIQIPKTLDVAGIKPWDIKHLDTLDLWKFGDYKHYTSLQLLSAIFDIPTPKDDIDGSQVAGVYYNENNLERIAKYCEKDVLTVARLLQKYRCEPMIADEFVKFSIE